MTPRRLRSNLRLLTQPWIGPILALITVICGGALGYRITEGWDWGDCFWMVLITINTIGYGEVEPLSTAGRLVTVLIIGGGVVVVQLTIQRLLGLAESGYFRQLRALRFRRKLRRMHDHVIICGYGRIGREDRRATPARQHPGAGRGARCTTHPSGQGRGCACSKPMPPAMKRFWKQASIAAAAWSLHYQAMPPISTWC